MRAKPAWITRWDLSKIPKQMPRMDLQAGVRMRDPRVIPAAGPVLI